MTGSGGACSDDRTTWTAEPQPRALASGHDPTPKTGAADGGIQNLLKDEQLPWSEETNWREEIPLD